MKLLNLKPTERKDVQLPTREARLATVHAEAPLRSR